MQKMITNYHTHTPLCHHASGTEREYVEAAIAGGLKVLGFSDHSPQVFPGGHRSGFRMDVSDTEKYVNTVLSLREEYKGQIEIKLGYEAEYYPAIFEDFLKLVRRFPCDYLIMGQHFIRNEYDGFYSGSGGDNPALLTEYVDQTCEAMRTGCFTYFAHPDLFRCDDDEIYRREYSRLIACSIETGVPLEINLLGIRGGRHYPSEKFWTLAGEMHANAVIGCDAHEPVSVADQASYAVALSMVEKYGLRLVEPVLRPLS